MLNATQYIKRLRIVNAILITLGAMALMTTQQFAYAEDTETFCTDTAKLAKKACKHDTKDDFWLANGNCSNIADDNDRAECFSEAGEDVAEAKEECRAIHQSRLEVCELLGESRYNPEIDPDDFVDPLQIGNTIAANPYFILTPGFTRVYEDGDETITVTVTNETIEIMGVTCIVVRDIVDEDGVVIEDTVDWHAQDIYGNVWYFGEIAQNYEDGVLTDLDGSFMAGKDGAAAGISMRAMPLVGDAYRQEWALSEAEDVVEVLSTSASESSPAADCNGTCIQTLDYSPLEPDSSPEHKFYAPGIGVIVEFHIDEPDERGELVDFFY